MLFRIVMFAVGIAVTLATVAPGFAQFPDSAEPPSVDAEADAEAPVDELTRQLESDASRGGESLPRAVQALARIGAWEAADRGLTRINSIPDQDRLAEAAQIIGSEFLLKISLHEGLSENARSAITKMSDALKAKNQSVDRLRKAIATLDSDNIDANLDANRTLLRGGDASVAALVGAIAEGISNKQRSKALSLLESLGGGRQALEQLSLYGIPSARINALDALVRLDRTRASDSLIVAAFATDSTETERSVAQSSTVIPDRFEASDAVALLAEKLRIAVDVAAHTRNDLTPATLWSVDENRSGVTSNRSTEFYQHYRNAYDAAQRLRRLGSLPAPVVRDVLSADLGYRLVVDVDWGDDDQFSQLRSQYPTAMSPEQLLVAIEEQRQREQVPATVGLIRVLAGVAADVPNVETVLGGRESRFAPIVDAVRDAHPLARYEAAALIAGLHDRPARELNFPGVTYYLQTLSEMASLGDRPTALLLESRPVVALRQETVLGTLGYDVRLVNSAKALEREVARGGDLELLVSKIGIDDASSRELVDRIRRLPKGSRLPIVFYRDAETNEKSVRTTEWETTSNRWISEDTPAVYLVDLPGSASAYVDVLAETNSKRRLPMLTATDRIAFKRVAMNALQGETDGQ